MAGPEQQTPSPEISFEEKAGLFSEATRSLADSLSFGSRPENDQWRSGGAEPTEQEQTAVQAFVQSLLNYKKEGEWNSVGEALDRDTGISLHEDDRRIIERLTGFLERQGISEEEVREEEKPEDSQQEGVGRKEQKAQMAEQTGSKGRLLNEERAELEARLMEELRGEEGGLRGAGEYYERWRQELVDELNGTYPLDKERRPVKSKLAELVDESTKDPVSRRRQYLTLILSEAMRSGSYLERQKMGFLMSDEGISTDEGAMFGAVEFVQKCQAAATGTTKVEQTEQMIGDPGPEVFLGLRNLTLKVEVETEDGEKYSGYVSPLQMMDLMDDPEWCHRLMTNRFDPGGKDPGYKQLRGDLLDELLNRRLKNERDEGLPKTAKIKSTNLYSFGKRRRIDNSQEKTIGISTRDLVLGELWWLHDAAWSIFCVGGRQRAWDKALGGRWQLPQMRKPLLPASYDGIKYNNELWTRRKFLRVIMWYDFWSEQAKYILPIFLAEKNGRKLKSSEQEWQIINRKVMRRGALPDREEEESKIALGLGEYSGRDWVERAVTWLNKGENITRKGEMKAWSEMRNVIWTDEERKAIAEVDFRPALERMQELMKKLKESGGLEERIEIKGETKGVKGYNQVVSQLSFQNLDYSALEEKAWLSQMSYTTAADHSFGVLRSFFQNLIQPSGYGTWWAQRKGDVADNYWNMIEGIKSKAKDAMRQLTDSIAYVSPAERTEAGTQLLHAISQGYTHCQREWLPKIKKPDKGQWEEDYVAADDEGKENKKVYQVLNDRRRALERLGYQFIKISNGNEKVFGPSGAPVRKLDRYEGHYCPVKDQCGGRPLGWRFISSLGNAALEIGLIGDMEAKRNTMKEIKAVSPDEWPSAIPGDAAGVRGRLGVGGVEQGEEERPGKRIKVLP